MTSDSDTPNLQHSSGFWHPMLAVAGFCGWSVVIASAVRELATAHGTVFGALRIDNAGYLIQGMFTVLFATGSMAAWVAGTSLLLTGLRFLLGKPMRYREGTVDERAFFAFYLACSMFLTTAAHQWKLWTILLPVTGGIITVVSGYADWRTRAAFVQAGMKKHACRVVDREIVHVLGPASTTEANVRIGATNAVHTMPYEVLANSPRPTPTVPAADLPVSPGDPPKPTWRQLTGDLAQELHELLATEADLARRVGPAPEAAGTIVPVLRRCDEILRLVHVAAPDASAEVSVIEGWSQWLERASQAIELWPPRLCPPMTSDDLTYSQGHALGAIRKTLAPHMTGRRR